MLSYNRKVGFTMAFSLHGVKLPHRKNTADMAAVRMTPPKSVNILMTMHIGKPATPIVKTGDHVDVGTLIGAPDGKISAPVHSSVSGTVKGIDSVLLSNGTKGTAITIESDGEMTVCPDICPPQIENKEDFLKAVRDSGIVGLGGAGFPTDVKLGVDESKKIEYFIINGAECEPYITSDNRTMIDNVEDMETAIDMIEKYLNVEKVIIAVENNKKKAIAKMKGLAAKGKNRKVSVLPSVYPQGGEKVLIYHTVGRVVEEGCLPIDVGCVVCNCTTVAAIGKYIKTGMPLVEKCITVDGGAVKEPKNVIVPIGTSLSDVFEFCGGFSTEPAKVIYGGPMMGIAVPDMKAPVLKNTNAILAFTERETVLPESTQCIHCGSCANQCPFGLNPAVIAKAYRNRDLDELIAVNANLCMECGCCAYVCPARIQLVMTNRLAKNYIKEEAAKAKGGN